jgi:hypothetical protein
MACHDGIVAGSPWPALDCGFATACRDGLE